MAKIYVYIGRFQPFHNAHAHVIARAAEIADRVIVLVGSAYQSRTIKNPFTYDERAEIIGDWAYHKLPDGKLNIKPLVDQPYNDPKWIQSVQKQVSAAISEMGYDEAETEIILTGSDRDDSTWYLRVFPQWGVDLIAPVPKGIELNATGIRKRLFEEENPVWPEVPAETAEFLNVFTLSDTYTVLKAEYDFMKKYKKAWEAAPYAPTFHTVDAVVIQSGHVLVVERGALPGKGLWALPGGFLNQNERMNIAVTRELREETGLKVPEKILQASIKSKEIFDHPDRSLRGRTITTAFLIRLDDTMPLPKVKGQNVPLHESGGEIIVETAKAFWLPINEALANSERWFEDHVSILSWAVDGAQ